jgi:hypothetical protein
MAPNRGRGAGVPPIGPSRRESCPYGLEGPRGSLDREERADIVEFEGVLARDAAERAAGCGPGA